ncbi:MAG: hypothetical protein LBP36_03270 [Oscillospiraceae bacterium]|jgi:penicillin-binding protein 2|nr:hypothetical protein [Oscillospiraceae bacterium]
MKQAPVFYNKKRLAGIFVCFGLVFSAFAVRLLDWQIINGKYYKARAASAGALSHTVDAVRGEIFDRDGVPLVVNNSGYNVFIERIGVTKAKENKLIDKTVELIERLGGSWRDTLPILFDSSGEFNFSEGKESQIKHLKELLNLENEASARQCINKMSEMFECEGFPPAKRRKICSVMYPMLKDGGSRLKSFPILISEDIDQRIMVVISELASKMPGLKVGNTVRRTCRDGLLAPHIIGFTGLMTSKEYEARKNEGYSMGALIGKTGAEAAFENQLRGIPGKHFTRFSRGTGDKFQSSSNTPPRPGNDVFLTISSKIQRVANESLAANIKSARNKGVKDCVSGAAVVIDVRDFSVIAAATYPTFDLKRLESDRNYYLELAADPGIPLFDRAISGTFAPGSVFKPLVACAALQNGVATPDEVIKCSGAFRHYHGYTLHCMGHHGETNLSKAISRSCNVYFAELGRRVGIEAIVNLAKKFGMGVKTGLELPESAGVLAGPEQSKASGTHWYESGSSQAAIGQSYNSFTPLQLAVYAASIATGKRMKTHVMKQITDYSGEKVVEEPIAEVLESDMVSEENLNIVRNAMREVVFSGTAADFRNFPVEIAAKTGTAQNSGTDHTTFICYAPFNEPEIAISVVIANGKFGMNSKNVARDIMKCYFGLD